MQFTTKAQDSLGGAVIIPDGDSAIIIAPAWMVVMPIALTHISEDILDLAWSVADEKSNLYLDYRVLNAKEVNAAEGSFIPFRDRAAVQLQRRASAGIDAIHDLIEERCPQVFQATRNLSEMFRAGEALPRYPEKPSKRKEAQTLIPRGGREAHNFLFTLERRELCINGDLLRGFHDLGADLTVCEDLKTHPGGLRTIGLVFPGDDFGFLAPLEGTQNKTRYRAGGGTDTQWVSWRPPEVAIALLEEEPHFFAPSRFDPGKRCVDQLTPGAARAYDLLRWHGHSDEEVDEFITEFAPKAWEYLITKYMEQLESCVQEYPEVCSRGKEWEILSTERRALEYQNWLSVLGQWTGVDIEIAELPVMEVE